MQHWKVPENRRDKASKIVGKLLHSKMFTHCLPYEHRRKRRQAGANGLGPRAKGTGLDRIALTTTARGYGRQPRYEISRESTQKVRVRWMDREIPRRPPLKTMARAGGNNEINWTVRINYAI